MFGKKNSKEEIESGQALDHSDETIGVSFYDNPSEGVVEGATEQPVNQPATQVETAAVEKLEVLSPPIISKPSILSQGSEFEGTIKTTGALVISGRIIGSITAGMITVENEGFVDGDIKADALTVKGNVLGEIRCRELTVGPNAHVDADSYFDTIEVQRGGKISGLLNKA